MKHITVGENRTLTTDNDRIGVNGEHNALILKFSFPKKINGIEINKFTKRIMFANEYGCCKRYLLTNDTCPLTIDITQGAWLEMQVELTYQHIRWKSFQKMFRFEPALDCLPGYRLISDIDFKCAFIPADTEDLRDAGLHVPEWIPKGTEFAPQPMDGERAVNAGVWSSYVLPFYENLTEKGLPAFIHTPIGNEFPAMQPDVTLITLPVFSNETPPDSEDWTERNILFFIDPIDEGTIELDEEEINL